ncbi:hypothetical protein Cgig2_021868 [Carnegiea gigantea]|uniref:MULE transposase domain-containing protein n=1 Tax=Carnegiea gigantea TaxID=171969 RepID=A0A9Q1Q7C3_9CARY|nr:hypothetical protein Cgig2_021868 [Carnegiea gigantea]
MGKHKEGFSLLARYTEMIKACKKGFLAGCRKFIRVDGTHIKVVYKGMLLTTMGTDAQNHCVPLVYAIVNVENMDNWSYFSNYLRGIIGDGSGSEYTFIADKCKGVIAALRDVFPAATRRICIVHYKRSYKKLYTSPILNMLLSRAANEYCEVNFHKFMESFKKESPAAYVWFQNEPTEHW